MKRYILALLYSVMAMTIGCTMLKSQSSHVGTWEADVGGHEKLIWVIDNTTLTFTLDGQTESQPYTIDYTKTPIWFDTVIAESNVRCIMEFLDDDTFRITGVDDENAPRLTSFDGAKDILTFKRK